MPSENALDTKPDSLYRIRIQVAPGAELTGAHIQHEFVRAFAVVESHFAARSDDGGTPVEVELATTLEVDHLAAALEAIDEVIDMEITELDAPDDDAPVPDSISGPRFGTEPGDASEAFKALQQEFSLTEPAGLLQDPEYLDFLDSFGMLDDPFENTASLDDLIEAATNQSPATADEAPAQAAPEPAAATAEPGRAEAKGQLVEALVRELRSDDVPEETVAALRDELGGAPPAHVQTQLDALQAQVATVTAYIDALEEFIDEHGDGRQLLDDVLAETDTIRDDVAALREDLGAAADERADLAAAVDALEDRVQQLAAQQAAVADAPETLAALEEAVDELEATVEALTPVVRQNEVWRERIEDVFTAMRDDDAA